MKIYLRGKRYHDNWTVDDSDETLEKLLEFLEKECNGKWEKGS